MPQPSAARTLLAIVALAAVLGVTRGPGLSHAAEPAPVPYVTGEVIVALQPGASAAAVGVSPPQVRHVSADGARLTIAVPPGEEQQYAERLSGEPGVAYAELNLVSQPAYVPNDSEYYRQWDMPMIDAEDAWDVTRGEGAIIAVVDTGVAFEDYTNHARSPELASGLFIFPYDATDGSEHPNDENGHGTHVTGTLAQDTDNARGPSGISPLSPIIPVKVCRPFGCSSDDIADGIRWAVDHGADVINMSIGGPSISRAEREAVAYAEERGVVLVAAAGNGGIDFSGDPRLDYPAALPTVVAVGAVDMRGKRTRYSNYGDGEAGHELFLVAPGGDNREDVNDDGFKDGILQNTFAHTCTPELEPSFTAFADCYYHGTSMATPHVAGAAALIRSRYPELTPAQVRKALACSAKDLGDPGVDDEYGAGLVQAGAALRDSDGDGVLDCVEVPVELTVRTGGGFVAPGGTLTVEVTAEADEPGITAYEVEVSVLEGIVSVTGCEPRLDATCEVLGDRAVFTSEGGTALAGKFSFGTVTVQGEGENGDASTLELAVTAEPTSETDPPVKVSRVAGIALVMQVPATVWGDVNCDFLVTPADPVSVLSVEAGFAPPFCVAYGNVNCLGALDSLDALALLMHLAGLEPTLPLGCPAIGDVPPRD